MESQGLSCHPQAIGSRSPFPSARRMKCSMPSSQLSSMKRQARSPFELSRIPFLQNSRYDTTFLTICLAGVLCWDNLIRDILISCTPRSRNTFQQVLLNLQITNWFSGLRIPSPTFPLFHLPLVLSLLVRISRHVPFQHLAHQPSLPRVSRPSMVYRQPRRHSRATFWESQGLSVNSRTAQTFRLSSAPCVPIWLARPSLSRRWTEARTLKALIKPASKLI